MAYSVKYILTFLSDRGYDYKVEVLEKGYTGVAIGKKMGVAPVLNIEDGDGCVQGSSLTFSIQSDVEGELQELYTTNNKQYQVILYRDNALMWKGYLLPELYSENYVCPPYDVSLTATDQLATLKALIYQREDVNVLLRSILEDVLSFTQISLPLCFHLQIANNPRNDTPLFENTYISQAVYNGYNCYDVLNAILQSANCRIMQINGQWLVTSVTDASNNYFVNGLLEVKEAKILGQMFAADVWPNGSLNMVNAPALKGATVEYSHILRNSFLINADCVDREGWSYVPDNRDDGTLPGEVESFGKKWKAYCWRLYSKNIKADNSLQLWQEVALAADEGVPYSLSVKYLLSTNAKLLLMSVTHRGSDGIDRQLTGEGWVTEFNKSDINSYIQITGTSKGASLQEYSDIEQYEMATVQFIMPPVDGTIKVGFINSTTDYADPLAYAPVYVTQVYLTLGAVSGVTSTTVVEENATSAQELALLTYGDDVDSANSAKLALNTLRRANGEVYSSWWLNGNVYESYFLMMLQEYSRFYGTKKRQLQGLIMGMDVLSNAYFDTFSQRSYRLLSAQYNLIEDEASVLLEEIVDAFVDYDSEVYATNNSVSMGSAGTISGGGGTIAGGSGESLFGVQSDGDVYVKDSRALVGQEARFENVALPVVKPTERKELKVYIYASDPTYEGGNIDLSEILKWIRLQKELWVYEPEYNAVRTPYNFITDGTVSMKDLGDGEGETEIVAGSLVDLKDVEISSPVNGNALVYNEDTQKWENKPIDSGLNEAALEEYLDNNRYAQIDDIPAIPESLPASDVYEWAKQENKPEYKFSEIKSTPKTLEGYGIQDALPNDTTYAASSSVGGDALNALKLGGKALSELFTSLQSNTFSPISATVGGITKTINQDTLRKSLGLDTAAYEKKEYFATKEGLDEADATIDAHTAVITNLLEALQRANTTIADLQQRLRSVEDWGFQFTMTPQGSRVLVTPHNFVSEGAISFAGLANDEEFEQKIVLITQEGYDELVANGQVNETKIYYVY